MNLSIIHHICRPSFRLRGLVFLFGPLLGLPLGGCLFEPGHEQVVCGADANLPFTGYSTGANATIVLQAADNPAGPFATIGTVQTSNQPTNIGDETYYSFSTSLPIDAWKSTPSGLSTYLRAMYGSYTLLTFDAQNQNGESGIQCVVNGIFADGKTASQAALDCDRNNAVVRIDAPLLSTCGCTPYAVPGDLVIDDAPSAAAAQCVTSVGGALRVLPSAPDLVSLASLTSINGDAELHYERFDPQDNPMYRNRTIDLSALTSIGGDVDLSTHRGSSAYDKSIDTLTHAVTFIGGDVTISTYDNNVNAFAGVTSLSGSVTFQGFNGPSSNLDVFGASTFPNLVSVGGDLTVQGFFACNGVFNSVQIVQGDLTVRAVRLRPGPSFQALQLVGQDLRFQQMKNLGDPWPALSTVGGDLVALNNTTFTNLNQIPVTADVNGIRLEGNTNLVNLNGQFQAGAGDITIFGSPSLSQCDVDAYLAAQAAGGWTGTASVNDTVPCP